MGFRSIPKSVLVSYIVLHTRVVVDGVFFWVDGSSELWMVLARVFTFTVAFGIVNVFDLSDRSICKRLFVSGAG